MAWALLKDGRTRWAASMAMVIWPVLFFGSQQPLAQINLTKHYLGSKQVAPSVRSSSSTETCVFCHTPQGADTSAAVPLWNPALASPPTYTTYNSLGSSSLDGATAPVGSVSIACLSCHDGVQARNVMIHSPRSALAGAPTEIHQARSRINGANISITGVDTRGEHSVGTQYGGGAIAPGGPPLAPGVYPNTLMRKSDFNSALSAILNEQSVWWVDSAAGAAGARDKTDIQLYTRISAPTLNSAGVVTAGLATGPEPFVECASCHDPHSAANATFLRFANTGSAVCLACHAYK